MKEAEKNINVYLNKEARECLDWLRSTGDIPKGFLSQKLQQAIIKEYKKQTRDL